MCLNPTVLQVYRHTKTCVDGFEKVALMKFIIRRHVKPLPNSQLEVLPGCTFISNEPHFTQ